MKFVLLVCWLAMQAAAQQPLTLDQAERTALEQHPRLKAAADQTTASRSQVQQVRGTLHPFLSANVTSSVADHGSRIGAGGLNASSLFSRFGTGISINQTLFDFGRTSKLAESMSTRADAQEAMEEAARAQVRWEVRQAYLRVLSLQKSLGVARASVETRTLARKQIEALVTNDLRSTLDLQFAEVALGEAEVTTARLEGELAAAEAMLTAAMGFADPRSFLLAEVPDSELSPDMEAFVSEALRVRPELVRQRRLLTAAQQFAESERRLLFPTVTAAGVFGFIPAGDIRLRTRYGGVGLNLNVPIFNGRTLEARRDEALARAGSASHEVRDLELRVAREVRTAYSETANARRQIGLAERQVTQARRLLSMAQLRYQNGLGTIVEVNQAELAQLSAELAATSSRYAYLAAQATLDLASGRLR